jgi:hypothetical protein
MGERNGQYVIGPPTIAFQARLMFLIPNEALNDGRYRSPAGTRELVD